MDIHQLNLNQIKQPNITQQQIKYKQMFNPKEALERIRRNKLQKQQQSSSSAILNQDIENHNSLFPQNKQSRYLKQSSNNNNDHINNHSLQSRMAKLQSLVTDLSQQLTQSNQTIEMLKRDNSQLETQVVKLEYENSQLKTSSKVAELKHSHSNRLNTSALLLDNSNNNNRMISSFNNDRSIIKKVDSKMVDDQSYSPEVEEVLEQIKKQPLENILKRKQQNFRALKNGSKDSSVRGGKAIKQLALVQKNYGKNYKKPSLIINLQGADFQ